MVEWVVIVYDKPNTSRKGLREEHLAAIGPNVEKGIVKNVGAIYHDIPTADNRPFAGSSFNIEAESREEVIEFLKQDIFAKKGIWDIENALIYPYGCVYREAKKLSV
ncbi:hypothetical protein PACTADRAFT_49863 [Pachysolen tannophilus NRRL Y-2460]|uniref:YCII-related domain-containing protein n=1 Tax=Pachysolen tannophilus NRRL Y-2460 TaxID=669874 RepID=A0A1E4TTM6_PACTA|nr:hypothetical protein PACTADRAFT_49863 [Pachysolen tannophilus NRRL Y-2460]